VDNFKPLSQIATSPLHLFKKTTVNLGLKLFFLFLYTVNLNCCLITLKKLNQLVEILVII